MELEGPNYRQVMTNQVEEQIVISIKIMELYSVCYAEFIPVGLQTDSLMEKNGFTSWTFIEK